MRKRCLFKCIAKLLCENHLAVKVLTSLKNSWNVQKCPFILLFHQPEQNWARKSFFQSDLTFYVFLITRWLRTTNISEGFYKIYTYQLNSNYLKNHKCFEAFFSSFGIYIKFSMFCCKKNSPSSTISEVIESEIFAYLNA